MLEDVLWKKLELPNLHTCKKKCMWEILIWNPKEHQQNTTRAYQRIAIEHSTRMSMNKKVKKVLTKYNMQTSTNTNIM
jgi:hypothetical protein